MYSNYCLLIFLEHKNKHEELVDENYFLLICVICHLHSGSVR